MKKYAKRMLLYLLLLCGLLFPSGCGQKTELSGNPTELWIVTEQGTWDRMNGQTKVLIEEFEQTHEGVTVRLDVLPTGEQERSVYLQQLRTQILQGGGPDGYLLPTDNGLILDEPVQYTYVDVEPLFVDVELAMQNGLFYDIAALYDGDDTLGKEGLNTAIMDAGVVDGARYVLPLRYDMPVIYAEEEALQAAGLDKELLSQDIGTIMEAVLETGDPLLAGGVLHDSFSAFSDFIDYDTGNTTLAEQTLAGYLETYQRLQESMGFSVIDNYGKGADLDTAVEQAGDQVIIISEPMDLTGYIFELYGEQSPLVWNTADGEEITALIQMQYYPLYVGLMQDALTYAPAARHSETELFMVPMRSIGGDVVATVTYYGAVGSGSDDPELTYGFLRQFLSEESQWELNRPEREHTKAKKGVSGNTSNDLQYPGLIEKGWPVRDKGSVEHMWQVRRMQVYQRNAGNNRVRQVGRSELEEERVPLFDVQIDQVRFNTTMSEALADALSQLNEPELPNAPAQLDIQELTRKLLWNVRWHVSEG